MNSLREKNIKFLAHRFPKIIQKLSSAQDQSFRPQPIIEDGYFQDFDLGHGKRLYGENCESFTAKQMEAFRRGPTRIEIPVSDFNITPAVKLFAEDLYNWTVDNLPPSPLTDHPVRDIGYIFIFGMGAGLHLPQLMHSGLGQNIVLMEPDLALFDAALFCVDLEDLVVSAERKGARVHLFTGDSREEFASGFHAMLIENGNMYLDGSTIYQHHDGPGIKTHRQVFDEVLPSHHKSTGFFEDNILMARNSHGNFFKENPPFLIDNARKHKKQEVPVVLVGSGPSLDKNLDELRRFAKSCVVVSLGTTLNILLKEGITPDFHVETENGYQTYKDMITNSKLGDLSKVIFISSITATPKAGQFFKSQWSYLRPGSCPSRFFAPQIEPLIGAAPLVSNAGLAALAVLGFRNFYFIGVDSGRRSDSSHHSEKSLYHQPDYDNLEALRLLETRTEFPVAANFGGEVLTTKILNTGRLEIEQYQEYHNLNIINCSDGAKFLGVPARQAKSISFKDVEVDKQALLETLEKQLIPIDTLRDKVPGIFKEKLNDDCDFFARRSQELREVISQSNRLRPFALFFLRESETPENRSKLGYAFASGTIKSMIRLGTYYDCRVIDPEQHQALLQAFADLFDKWGEYLQRELNIFVEDIIAGKEELHELPDNLYYDTGQDAD